MPGVMCRIDISTGLVKDKIKQNLIGFIFFDELNKCLLHRIIVKETINRYLGGGMGFPLFTNQFNSELIREYIITYFN